MGAQHIVAITRFLNEANYLILQEEEPTYNIYLITKSIERQHLIARRQVVLAWQESPDCELVYECYHLFRSFLNKTCMLWTMDPWCGLMDFDSDVTIISQPIRKYLTTKGFTWTPLCQSPGLLSELGGVFHDSHAHPFDGSGQKNTKLSSVRDKESGCHFLFATRLGISLFEAKIRPLASFEATIQPPLAYPKFTLNYCHLKIVLPEVDSFILSLLAAFGGLKQLTRTIILEHKLHCKYLNPIRYWQSVYLGT